MEASDWCWWTQTSIARCPPQNRVLRSPPVTQRRIADYLDRETARIDALVAEKESMLALLEEKRAALISSTVTRGLNPDAPLKPSDLDWLGDIPAHWDVLRIKHDFRTIGSGTTPPTNQEELYDGDVPWVTTSSFVKTLLRLQKNRSQKMHCENFQH